MENDCSHFEMRDLHFHMSTMSKVYIEMYGDTGVCGPWIPPGLTRGFYRRVGMLSLKDMMIWKFRTRQKFARAIFSRWVLMRKTCSPSKVRKFIRLMEMRGHPIPYHGEFSHRLDWARIRGVTSDDIKEWKFSDTFVKKSIVGSAKIPFKIIPKQMVEAKRVQLKLTRLLKERSHAKYG